MPTNEQVTEALKAVIDPELRRNIVELGMVRSIDFFDGGRVDVVVSLTTPGLPDPLALRAGRHAVGHGAGGSRSR